jgi:uncharacterized protein DUF1064
MATRGFENVTLDQAQRMGRQPVQPKPSKYRNVRVVVDGEKFDSKREANEWLRLKALEDTGDVRKLQRQVRFALMAPTKGRDSFAIVAEYVADFVYEDYDLMARAYKQHVVDVKGVRTQMYRLKRKWLELQENIVIEEV